jgi:hypothetical protein
MNPRSAALRLAARSNLVVYKILEIHTAGFGNPSLARPASFLLR